MESLMKTKSIESKKHLFSLIILSYLGSFCNGVMKEKQGKWKRRKGEEKSKIDITEHCMEQPEDVEQPEEVEQRKDQHYWYVLWKK